MAQLSIMSAGRAIQVSNVTSQMNHTVYPNLDILIHTALISRFEVVGIREMSKLPKQNVNEKTGN